MIYLSSFSFPCAEREYDFIMNEKRTCYDTFYPFQILSRHECPTLEFEPVTILYGGNGSGKTTALNVIGETLALSRDTLYNRTNFFEDYIRMCAYQLKHPIPEASRLVTSDDVFDFMLNLRAMNRGIDQKRDALFQEYWDAKYSSFQMRSLDDYEQLKKVNAARSKSQSRYVRNRLMPNIRERSNGESAFLYFTEKITENGLYLLDEPESSLSPKRQQELLRFLEDSARFFGCQFIIATHSLFLLSMKGAKIYDMDEDPVNEKSGRNWTMSVHIMSFSSGINENSNEGQSGVFSISPLRGRKSSHIIRPEKHRMEEQAMVELVEALTQKGDLPDHDLLALMTSDEGEEALAAAADAVRRKWYGTDVYIRGLIEFTNYCKNDCYYCGIRRSNGNAQRYRLTEEQIMDCCRQGWALGFRTFVLQGGEDPWFTDQRVCHIVQEIKRAYPDCAVTLSIGEKSRESYAAYRAAGADRYLLRHETANEGHYRKLHPASLSLANRKRCLFDLKELGYQVGSGFMVGAPGQKPEYLIEDLRFLQELQPDMIGIGPYITHQDTPFRDQPSGGLHLTLRMVSILRLMFPDALIPATTALGTIHPQGRELGLKAGANVVMPNLSPVDVRQKYTLYENKICTGEEAAECRFCLEGRIEQAGYRIVTSRGDRKTRQKEVNG